MKLGIYMTKSVFKTRVYSLFPPLIVTLDYLSEEQNVFASSTKQREKFSRTKQGIGRKGSGFDDRSRFDHK